MTNEERAYEGYCSIDRAIDAFEEFYYEYNIDVCEEYSNEGNTVSMWYGALEMLRDLRDAAYKAYKEHEWPF